MTSRCMGCQWKILFVYDALMVIMCVNCGLRRVYERHYGERPGEEDTVARASAALHSRAAEDRY